MTFNELLKNRRSVRKYEDKPVPIDVVHELIRVSTCAPSAGNEQPWKYIIISDRDLMKEISDESKKNILDRITGNPSDHAGKYEGMLRNESFNVFYNAPCLVMILGLSHLKNLQVDCALAAAYFMMAAAEKGLGTCWVNLGMEIYDPILLDRMGVPNNCAIVAPIIVGYPENIPAMPARKPPEILKTIP